MESEINAEPEVISTEMHGITKLEELQTPEKTASRLRKIGLHIAERCIEEINNNETRPVVVVTNGGLLPTLIALAELSNLTTIQTPIAIASKSSYNKAKFLISNNEYRNVKVVIPEDIAESGNTLQRLEKILENIQYYPFSYKPQTNPQFIIPGLSIYIPNKWGLSAAGMNSGHFDPFDRNGNLVENAREYAEITALERLAGVFLFPEEGIDRDYIIKNKDEYRRLLEANQLPEDTFPVPNGSELVFEALVELELTQNLNAKVLIISKLFEQLQLSAIFEM